MRKKILPAILHYFRRYCKQDDGFSNQVLVTKIRNHFAIKPDIPRINRWINGSPVDPLKKEYLHFIINYIKETIKKESLDSRSIVEKVHQAIDGDREFLFAHQYSPYLEENNHIKYLEQLIIAETEAYNNQKKNKSEEDRPKKKSPSTRRQGVKKNLVMGIASAAFLIYLILQFIILPGRELSSTPIHWKVEKGYVNFMESGIILRGSNNSKATITGQKDKEWNCRFLLTIEKGNPDSSIGLVVWAPREYALTFRGGLLKIISGGTVKKEIAVSDYTGKLLEIKFIVSSKQLFASIYDTTTGDLLAALDEPNIYWEEKLLMPRCNADFRDRVIIEREK